MTLWAFFVKRESTREYRRENAILSKVLQTQWNPSISLYQTWPLEIYIPSTSTPPRWIPSSYPAQCVCAKTYLDVVGMHQPRTIFGTPRFDSGEGCLARHPTVIHGSREYVRRP